MTGEYTHLFPIIYLKIPNKPRKMHFSQKKPREYLVDSEKCISFAIANKEQRTTKQR